MATFICHTVILRLANDVEANPVALFSTLIICGFCGKEFVSLGRHSWRCKSKVGGEQGTTENINPATEMPTQLCLPIASFKAVKCCCGKVCKGARGLKMHQCSCRVIDDLEDELQEQMTEALNSHQNEDDADPVNHEIPPLNTQENFPELKRGIKLSKSPLQWSTANDFFKLAFANHPITPHDLNNNISTMATVIYNYFSENFGFVENNNDIIYRRKYQSFSAKDLKKALKKLKMENGDILEIKFVAKKLRTILSQSSKADQHVNSNHSTDSIFTFLHDRNNPRHVVSWCCTNRMEKSMYNFNSQERRNK